MSGASHVLYRHFGHDETLLYVGITNEPPVRLRAHRKASPWWDDVARTTYEAHPSREALKRAERAAIKAEHPLWNVVHNKTPRPAPKPAVVQRRIDPGGRLIPLTVGAVICETGLALDPNLSPDERRELAVQRVQGMTPEQRRIMAERHYDPGGMPDLARQRHEQYQRYLAQYADDYARGA